MGKAVKAVAAVAVGVAVGFATGNPYLGVLAGGAMFASGSLTPKVDMGTATQTELKQVIRSSKEPAHFQFGACAVGGLLAWAQEEAGTQSETEWLHLVYVLSEGEIEALSELYLNQEPASSAGDRVRYALIRNPSAADAYLLANSPDWRDTQIGAGLSYVRLSIRYDRDYWASGIPTPLFVLQGCREIYDPRSGTTGYSDNAALVILWYLRTRLRVPDDEIIWEMFIDGANIADEPVAVPGGGTERRYRIGGGFKADARKDRVLADMEAACAGRVVRIGGRFGLQVGAYYGPYELTIDEDMVIGAVTGQTEVSQADAVNTMTGKFIDPEQRWTETDYPAVSVAEWVEQDDGPIEDTLDLQLVYSPYQAQRLANIALRRKRNGGGLSMPLNFRGYACRPGRVVRVYLPSLNIDGEFRVTDWNFHGDNGCKVTLSPEDPEIYDDAVGQPYNPLGFISLPTGGIAAPSGLTYTLEAIGETVQGRLDWSAVSGALTYSVVIKSGGASVQAVEVPASSTTCTIGGLPAGQYVAEVRTRGDFGQSGAATVSFSVNAPPMPDRIIVQVTNSEVTLIPQLAWSGTPVSFRFYYSPTLLDINAVRGSAQLLSTGASLVHAGRAYGTTYHYWVESVNAYGHSDLLHQEVQTADDFFELADRLNQELSAPGRPLDQLKNGQLDNAQAISDARQEFETGLGEASDQLAAAQGRIDEISSIAGSNAQQVKVLGQDVSTLTGRTVDAEAAITETQRIARLNSQLEAFESKAAQVQTAAGAAAYTVERIQRVGADEALSQVIIEVDARLSGSIASVRTQVTSLTTTSEALADSLTQLTADFGDTTAEFESRITALSTTTEGLVAETSRLSTALDDAEASINEVRRVQRLNAQLSAFESKAMQVQTTAGAAEAKTQQLVSASGRQALAQQITELDTRFGTSTASINSQLTALSTKTSANATRQETFEAQVDDQFGSVQQSIGTIIDPDAGVVAQALTTVEVNGNRGIVGIQAFGEEIQFVAVANKFAVYNPIAGEYVLAFVITDGRVVIPDARIDKVTVTKLVSETGETLIQGGKIKAKFIDADNITAREVISNLNAANGRPCFALKRDGSLELNASSGSGSFSIRGPLAETRDASGRLRVRMGVW